jgi:hypothetical protein
MTRYLRLFLYAVCAVQGLTAAAFILRLPITAQLWPLPYSGDLPLIFIGSIYAAATAATAWCLWAREDAGLRGIALDYVALLTPMAVLTLQLSEGRRAPLLIFSLACVIGIMFALLLLWVYRRAAFRDQRPTPRLVRGSFAFFVVALIVLGGALILKVPNILPWDAPGANGVLYGWMFMGAAVFFAYGVVRPVYGNAVGQLLGFLAYDLVLIVPFLLQLPTITEERRLSLIVYILVVSYSGALAIYYCVLHPQWRIWRVPAVRVQP